MAKNTKISRLSETSFSSFNLREAYVNDTVDYLASLRDESLFSNWGVTVLIKIPIDDFGNINENNVDEYSNFVDTEWMDTTETVIPKFTEYRQNVSEEGMSADGTDALYPLEVLIPSKLHLPRNSRIIFTEFNSREEKIAREWIVLGTVQKQLSNSKTYTRIANCVPARKELFNTSELSRGIIWFDYDSLTLDRQYNLQAQGNIWFVNTSILRDKVRKIIKNEVFEQIPEYPEYNEQLNLQQYYDSRPINIIESGSGFKVGEIYTLLDEMQQIIYIKDLEHNVIPLELYVTKVSEDKGELLEYSFNVERGYTALNGEAGIQTTFGNQASQAVVNLRSYNWEGEINQEVLITPEIKNPKYLQPYQMDAIFITKRIAISVLN